MELTNMNEVSTLGAEFDDREVWMSIADKKVVVVVNADDLSDNYSYMGVVAEVRAELSSED